MEHRFDRILRTATTVKSGMEIQIGFRILKRQIDHYLLTLERKNQRLRWTVYVLYLALLCLLLTSLLLLVLPYLVNVSFAQKPKTKTKMTKN